MVNCQHCFRCFIYIAFCYTTIKGSPPALQSSDRHPSSTTIKSSPFAHNGTEQLYSEWSKWTSCSSTCGLGIITRTRTCLKSAYNSRGVYVPLCHAEYSEHKICSLKECPSDAPQARDILCSHHNNKTVAGKLIQEWIPVNAGPNPCELRCKAVSEGLEYGFGKVSNGTPCPQGVCLDGRCLKVGCDDRLGSEVVLDMCGICGGRNASCVHYKDVYLGQPPADSERRNGYHEVVVLPVGARNLIIRQLVGKNYLALQDRTRGIIFNGEHHLTQYGNHYNIAGTAVQFEKSDNTTEILTAKGPVTEELYILVLLRTFNQGIYYEYWLPKQTHNPSRGQFPIIRGTKGFPALHASTTTLRPTTVPVYTPVHYRPTKPAFAYGFGEKPYRSQDAPIFRHYIATTTFSPRYKLPVPQPYVAPQHKSNVYSGNSNLSTNKKDVNSLYRPRTFRPTAGYYQTFRNASVVNVKKVQDLDKELPVLTQPDSSGSNGRIPFDNIIPNTVLDEKKHEVAVPKSQKPSRTTTIEISKRGEKANKFVTNGRLKYSLQDTDEVYVNASGRYTPAPLSIALLPLPDGDYNKSSKGSKKGSSKRPKKPRSNGGACAPCERSRDQTKHFCESDFVIRAEVIGYEFLNDETRYELEVKQTYKNTLSLLTREYVWSPDTCRCPKLRPGKEYVIMGRIDNNYRKRESRLLVDKTCFVRTYNLKFARRLQKLRKDHSKRCTKTS